LISVHPVVVGYMAQVSPSVPQLINRVRYTS
jgi:hypothetical protein